MNPSVLANAMAVQPAKAFGIYGRKGDIKPGFDADLVIYDPDYQGIITQKDNLEGIGYETFEGFEMTGRPEQVFLRGMLVAENGRFTGRRGCGHRIFAKPYAAAYKHFRPAL